MNTAKGDGKPSPSRGRIKINHDWTNPAYTKPLTDFQRFIRNGVDWQTSPLGLIEHWPAPLRQMVLLVVADPAPAVICYGHPDEAAVVYNEAYTGLIGSKHPKLQGQLARIEFSEVWDYFDKLLREQMESGLTSIGEAHPLLIHRHGFLEESFFSFKFIPVVSPDDGSYLGSYATITEHTAEVLFERRMATVQKLGNEVAQATTLRNVWQAIIKGLAVSEHDLPMAAVYSVSPDVSLESNSRLHETSSSQTCKLEGSLGISSENGAVHAQFDLQDTTNMLALAFTEVAAHHGALLLQRADDKLPTYLFNDRQTRGHGVPCESAVICAIKDNFDDHTIAFLLLGLNPRRPYDAPYQDFIRMLTKQVTTPHVSNVLLREQVEAGRVAATQSALERMKLDERLAAKNALYEHSELKFSRFADSLSMGVGIVDHKGRVIYGNKPWRRLVGIVDDNDEEPFSFFKSMEPDQEEVAHKLWADLEAMKPVNAILSFKVTWTAPDGQEYPTTALVTAYTDVDPRGEPIMMSCVADVSELKWIEDRLRQRTAQVEQSELRYRKFADLAPVGVCVMSQERIIHFTNDAFLKIMPHSTLSQDMLNCVHPSDVDQVKVKLASLKDTLSSVTFECRLLRVARNPVHGDSPNNNLDSGQDCQEEGKHGGDGNVEESPPAWILASAHLEKNPEPQIICWVTDITSQKVAQSVIQRRMNEALETKRQQERFIDMTSHEIRNPLSAVMHCTEEIIDNCKKRTDDLIENTLEAAQTIEYCASHIRNIVGDVLALGKLESDLVEIHTMAVKPKEVIMNALKMFGSEAKAKNINITCQEHESIRELDIEWLLLDPHRVSQVLINLVTNAIKFVNLDTEHKICVLLSASTELPVSTPQGVSYVARREPRRRVSFPETEKQTTSIFFSVTIQDNGLGLREEEKNSLFQRFKQANPKTESRYGGSGLGLFISRDLVELHGGGIGVASQQGVGSTFVFYVETKRASTPEQSQISELPTAYLPLQQSRSELAARVARAQSEAGSHPPRFNSPPSGIPATRVLIVEDNMINLKVLSKQLIKNGFEVATAIHGEDALKVLFAASSSQSVDAATAPTAPAFNIILMDIEMPVMDGVTCVKQIRAAEAHGQLHGRLPIIAVTANVRDELTKAAMLAGVDAITTKPYSIAELVAQIGKICPSSLDVNYVSS